MFARLFRKKMVTDEDSETLLPSSPSASAAVPTARPRQSRRSRDHQIAIRTLLICTAVYVTASVGIALSIQNIQNETFVENADSFCLGHISQYCKRNLVWEGGSM